MIRLTSYRDKSMLENALKIVRQANTSPRVLKKRLIVTGTILGTAVLVAIGTLIAIGLNVPETESTKLLAAFVFLGAIAVSIAGVCTLVSVLLTTCAYYYLENLELRTKSPVYERIWLLERDQVFVARIDKQPAMNVFKLLRERLREDSEFEQREFERSNEHVVQAHP